METTLSGIWKTKTGNRVGSVFEHLWIDESRLTAATKRFVARLRGAAAQSLARLFADHGRQLDAWMVELREQATTIGLAMESDSATWVGAEDAEPKTLSPRAILADVLSLHDRIAERLRNDLPVIEYCDDSGRISRPLSRLLEFHETTAWMLRVLLTSPELVRVK